MKTLAIVPLFVLLSNSAFAGESQKPVVDHHNSIYTMKIKRIVNAIDLGNFPTEEKYLGMLKTACERNSCSAIEKQTVQSVGQQIVNCQIKHLKSHNIENSDATTICQSKQAMLGCDSLATSLLRKMCYTGNRYSLSVWKQKEKKTYKNRMPASQ